MHGHADAPEEGTSLECSGTDRGGDLHVHGLQLLAAEEHGTGGACLQVAGQHRTFEIDGDQRCTVVEHPGTEVDGTAVLQCHGG